MVMNIIKSIIEFFKNLFKSLFRAKHDDEIVKEEENNDEEVKDEENNDEEVAECGEIYEGDTVYNEDGSITTEFEYRTKE